MTFRKRQPSARASSSLRETGTPPSYIIGIDEVGRGPLAGPVVVCAVAIPIACKPNTIVANLPLRDSKKLTSRARAMWASAVVHDPRIVHAIASSSPAVIDRINIRQATNRAATRALERVLTQLPLHTSPTVVPVHLDGGLRVNAVTFPDPNIVLRVATVIKGDETIPAISLASIVAKEHRDAHMQRMHKKYPLYGFDRHVGYGTRHHISMIHRHGSSPLHRASFLKKISS